MSGIQIILDPGTGNWCSTIGVASTATRSGAGSLSSRTNDGAPSMRNPTAGEPTPVASRLMYVTDLNHFLDLPEDAPGPARRLAGKLADIVRAASAGDAGQPWASALPCRRGPGRKPCPGPMTLTRTEPEVPIHWQCDSCGDDGIISNWAKSLYDLRRHRLGSVDDIRTITLDNDTAATLRDLQFLDPDCERLVYAMRAARDGATLTASLDDLDELIGGVAAEGNHEPNRRRQHRLDAAYTVLTDVARIE